MGSAQTWSVVLLQRLQRATAVSVEVGQLCWASLWLVDEQEKRSPGMIAINISVLQCSHISSIDGYQEKSHSYGMTYSWCGQVARSLSGAAEYGWETSYCCTAGSGVTGARSSSTMETNGGDWP